MTSLVIHPKPSSFSHPDHLPEVSPGFPIQWRGSIHYEKARVGRVFNHRRPSRFPIAVVEATHEPHIVEAVRLANDLKCRVSVRSGGHSWAAWSVRDNAILIDLGKYHEFSLDESTGIVKVSPSMTGRMLNSYLDPKGRMFPGGHCPDNWGWASERVLGVDVVTADGRQLHCDANENRDLYFAARGAGPGFPAIVTRFYLKTEPKYSCMRSSAYIYKKEDYRKALSWVINISPTFDSDTEIVAVASYPPGATDVQIMVLFVTFKNNEEEARKSLRPADDTAPTGTVGGWFMGKTSLSTEYDAQAAANPESHRYCAENAYIGNNEDVVNVLERAFTTLPSRKSFSLWYSMAPGCRRKNMPDMALSMQSDHYFAAYTVWENEWDDERCQSWVRRDWDPEGRICGYLDAGDRSGLDGLRNIHEWKQAKM
ncbi:oxidoreductase [Zopfia rhizophila CBS 207.26]|uniref:Oxidoreductase n=1 Tax=Zopfia rhizophila CBS 207.26 TaxID=1314779 RepID=A0A6A6EWB8_9PEZI|nr:oxidoreductase [Zopfia rhizophila CBS 207.26]